MKKIYALFILIVFSYFTSFAYDYSCSAACQDGCVSWYIEYDVDCGGNIETYTAVYFNGGYNFEFIDDISNPEFIGMDPTSLDGDCETSVCP